MASITSAGVGSGLNVESIITGLMNVEKIPLNDIATERSSTKSKVSMYGLFKNYFGELKTAADNLSKLGNLNPQVVSSSDDKQVSASASETATSGQYKIEVSQLAKSQSIAVSGESDVANTVGSGSLTITLGSYLSTPGSFTPNASKTPVTVNIPAGTDSLGDIKDAINAANAGVNATIVNDGSGYRMVLTSKETGENMAFKIDVTDNDGNNTDGTGLSRLAYDPTSASPIANNMTALNSAQDAKFKVNNLDIKKSSNTVTDAVAGLTLNLKNITTAPITVDVTRDDTALKKNLQSFVDAYNKVQSTMKEQQTKDSTLAKDSGPYALERALRSTIRSWVGTSGVSLNDIGISFDKTGAMSLDQSKLNKTLANDPDALVKVFADKTVGGTTTQGLGKIAANWVKSLSDPGGLLASKTDNLNGRLKSLDDKESKLNLRLADIEKRYRAQYSALDSTLASMQQTSTYLSQQLAALSTG